MFAVKYSYSKAVLLSKASAVRLCTHVPFISMIHSYRACYQCSNELSLQAVVLILQLLFHHHRTHLGHHKRASSPHPLPHSPAARQVRTMALSSSSVPLRESRPAETGWYFTSVDPWEAQDDLRGWRPSSQKTERPQKAGIGSGKGLQYKQHVDRKNL